MKTAIPRTSLEDVKFGLLYIRARAFDRRRDKIASRSAPRHAALRFALAPSRSPRDHKNIFDRQNSQKSKISCHINFPVPLASRHSPTPTIRPLSAKIKAAEDLPPTALSNAPCVRQAPTRRTQGSNHMRAERSFQNLPHRGSNCADRVRRAIRRFFW